MRATTMVWIGIRHVGDGEWKVEPKHVPAAEGSKIIARVMQQVSLAQRLDICVARSEGEVLDRLTGRAGKDAQAIAFDTDEEWNAFEAEMTALANKKD